MKGQNVADKLDMLTENMDKLAVSMNDLRQRPRGGRDSSRNRNRSLSREEINIEVTLDKGTETEVTQETGHGPEEETEGIDIMLDNTEVEKAVGIIIEILSTIGIETIRDSRSGRGDRSRGNNRKGYNGYNNRRSNHCAG